MSIYIYSKWIDHPNDCPKEFYCELDAERFETRKIEIYSDGRMAYADKHKATLGASLSVVPAPALSDLRSQHEFEAREITLEEFEVLWLKATEIAGLQWHTL